MIGISLDVDWAPDAAIADTLEIIEEAGAPATVFATHETPVLHGLDRHEVGIHPNFLNSGPGDWEGVVDELLGAYGDTQGVRCHSYHHNTPILELFAERGLVYDSNIIMHSQSPTRPFRHFNGLIRLPVFWEDNCNWIVGGGWDPADLKMDEPESVYVYDFHPIHVFLNTESAERYEAARPHYHDPDRLLELRNPESSGTGSRVFLKRLLASGREFVTLIDMARAA